MNNFTILKVTEEITDIAIDLIEKYSKGHGLKIPDALIAATTLYYDAQLWTYNIRDFRYIAGLKLFELEDK